MEDKIELKRKIYTFIENMGYGQGSNYTTSDVAYLIQEFINTDKSTIFPLYFPRILVPHKYIGSTYKGEKIIHVILDVESIKLITDNLQFEIEGNYASSMYNNADSILCEIQSMNDINVSKY